MGKRILLVDDDRDLVMTMSEGLEAEGYEVIHAYDGQQGLEMAKQGKPDLIVLDVMMPNKHGYQVAQELADSDQGGTPLIMLTAVGEHLRETKFSHTQALECIADDFISKPLNMDALLRAVKKLLPLEGRKA